jgi:hypothetical protein
LSQHSTTSVLHKNTRLHNLSLKKQGDVCRSTKSATHTVFMLFDVSSTRLLQS